MAVDVVLWFILATAVALIYCGCVYTAPEKRRGARHDPVEQRLDRAA